LLDFNQLREDEMDELKINESFWDFYAEIYDEKKADFDKYLRGRSIKTLQTFFKPGQNLIEIGCGTGTESIEMIKYGCKLTLTDLSFQMLKRAYEKIGDKARYVNLPAEYIDSFKIQFDGAYSSFGVLNCVTDIGEFFKKLHTILKPNAYFIASIINRWYWGDFLFFALGITNYLKKRLKGWGYISVDGKEYNAKANFYSVFKIKKMANPYFKLEKCIAFPFLLPPPYLKPKDRLPEKVFKILDKIENALNGLFPFKYFGEQTIFIFRRR
jgi:ubiquinone/menaquinone biosynthesis C-methylase UbiE